MNTSAPVCMSIYNAGNTSNLIMKASSLSGFVEGMVIPDGLVNTHTSSNASSSSTEQPLFSIRNRTTYNSVQNRVRASLEQLSTANDVNQLATFRIYLNCSVSAGTWVDVNTDNSIIEYNHTASVTFDGKVLYEGSVGKDTGTSFGLDKFNFIIIPGDIITITSILGGNAGVTAATLIWREDF